MARELAHSDTNEHKVWEIRTKVRTDYKEGQFPHGVVRLRERKKSDDKFKNLLS